MMLGSKGRYAVMAMVELAKRSEEKPTSLADIAQAQEIPLPYLEQIFNKLKHAGLVKSVRGPGGGYHLGRTKEEIVISAVVQAMDEPMKMTRCESHGKTGCMADRTRCLTHDLWDGLGEQIFSYLSSITLADVCARKIKNRFSLSPESRSDYRGIHKVKEIALELQCNSGNDG